MFNLTKIDKFIAEEIMLYTNVQWITYYNIRSDKEFVFTPTLEVKDAFKLLNRFRGDIGCNININTNGEVSVLFGEAEYSHPHVATAICLAVLKHFKIDLSQFESYQT